MADGFVIPELVPQMTPGDPGAARCLPPPKGSERSKLEGQVTEMAEAGVLTPFFRLLQGTGGTWLRFFAASLNSLVWQ
jgi:hypothetical protein